MSDKVSFKNTLNLPQTEFPIRPHAKENDPKMIARWEQEELYKKAFELNQGEVSFILPDGPPYANGHIHIGHAYNKILKDMVTKSQRMLGKHVPIIPLWDCHGLPIELKVSQEHADLSVQALKKKCREYAAHWMSVQGDEFKKLGIVMDWDNAMATMDFSYEATILRSFGTLVEQGYIERKNKTVPWCGSCQTVLATAEIEYKDRKDPSTYVLFPLQKATSDALFPELSGKEVSLLVWTTTPWTLPLNRAVLLRPGADYVVLEGNGSYFIVGKALADKVSAASGIDTNVVAEFKSEKLDGSHVQHPFIDGQLSPILLDNSVALDEGTACLHSAPGCGPEDYEFGVRNGLEIYSPLSADGKYTDEIKPAELAGMPVTEGQIWVLRKLVEKGRLLFKKSITHPYPHCWRCRNGLMFRATKQWFCDLSHNDLKKKALATIPSMKFYPETGAKSLHATIENRWEWCLSRQRAWGVPIPALLCVKCEHPHLTPAWIEEVAQGVEKQGVEYWDTVDPNKVNATCENCSGTEFCKEQDILDVWFDSGVSHEAVVKKHPALSYPADLYLEGKDQYRGWFQSSLLTSMVLSDAPCTKAFLTHGFTVDKKGRKMSKSLGNVVAPQELIDKLGTDGVRLWVSSIDYKGEAVVSDILLRNVQEVFRKVRNTCRFLLSNLYDFDIKKDAVALDKLSLIDRRALSTLHAVNEKIIASYQTYDFTAVFHELADYCTTQLSSFYLDIVKDRLYVEQADGHERRSTQTACWHILDTMTRLIAPVLSITAEQLSDHYQFNKTTSIHLQSFNDLKQLASLVNEESNTAWRALNNVRSAILKAIEGLREQGVIKHSLEASVTVYLDTKYLDAKVEPIALVDGLLRESDNLGKSQDDFLKELLIVSQCKRVDSPDGLDATELDGVRVRVERAAGDKCPRCWHWTQTDHEHNLCARCVRVVG